MTSNLDTFTRAYIEAALWSSTAYGSEAHREAEAAGEGDRYDTSFERENYDLEDLAPELLAQVVEDCTAFQRDERERLERAYASETVSYDDGRAGHDFWLTRNGHGAGFWDRGLGTVGDELSKAATVYGSEDWYVGDDGKVYGQ